MSEITPQAHPAKFSDALLPVARHLLTCVAGLPTKSFILDPFAGVGKGLDYMVDEVGFLAEGIELEPEWAKECPLVSVGDALALPFRDDLFDAVFTSPSYGNRMADRDMRESVAGTYAKSLGRHASEGSSCHLQWGDPYREFHVKAWVEAKRVLKPHSWFLLNIKDHVRGGEVQHVSDWHVEALESLGFTWKTTEFVVTTGLRRGANRDARVGVTYRGLPATTGEYLHLMELNK